MKIPVLFIILFIFCIPGLSQKPYEIYALKFDYGSSFAARDVAVNAKEGDSVRVCNMIWFLKGPDGKNILVDTGYLDSTNNTNYIRPDIILKEIGIQPSDITDIVLTHPHFDHINGLSLFPYGKVWMQKKDFDYFVAGAWQENGFSDGFRKPDVHTLIDASLSGRLNLVDGDNIEIIPGIRVFSGSTHTHENQYLLINPDSGNRVLLASDAIWFFYNLDNLLPVVKYAENPESYVNAMKRMKTLVTDPDLIIPGHDDILFSRFPKVTERVIKIE